MPTVSVVIPTHNRPQLLARALASVVSQTFRDFEIVVVQNDGNRDSETVVRGFQGQGVPIRYMYEPKPDPTRARNIGIQASTGKYLAFLDDDDEWLPKKLETQVAALGLSPGIGLVACRAHRVNGQGDVIDEKPEPGKACTFKSLVTDDCANLIVSLSAVMIRRECFDRLGFFDVNYLVANDMEFYLRLAKQYRIMIIEGAPLLRYMFHENNLSKRSENRGCREVAVIMRLQKFPEKFGVTPQDIQGKITRYCRWLYGEALDLMEAQKFTSATRKIGTALYCDPFFGIRIPWGRFSNPYYRTIRPYLAIFYCGLLSLAGSAREEGVS